MNILRFQLLIVGIALLFSGQISAQSEVDTMVVNQLLQQSRELSRVGEFDEALSLLERSDSLSNIVDYEEGKVKTLVHRADIYIDQNNFDSAQLLLNEAIQNYPESNERLQFHNLLGAIYSKKEMELRAAQEFEKAREYLDRLPEDEFVRMDIGLLQNLAVVYNNLGQKDLAFEYYQDVIEQATALKDTSILTHAYNNIGQAYNTEDQLDKAQYYLEKALEMAKSQNNKVNLYRAHLNYANVMANQEKYENALEHYRIAGQLFSEIRPNVPPAIILHNTGATLAKLGRYEEAENMLNESLRMCIDGEIRRGIYFNHFVLGNMYLELGRYEEAIRHLEQAADIAENAPSIDFKVDSYEALQEAYASAEQYDKAYDAVVTYKTYADSLAEINKKRELSGAENRMELSRQSEINRLLEEKQAQQAQQIRTQYYLIIAAAVILILIIALWLMTRKRSQEKEELLKELQRRKEELEELNKAKDRIFAIVSHDLRSPLTSVQGVFELIKDELIVGEDLKELVEGVDYSLRENVGVIEEILTWAKKQLSGFDLELKHLELKPMIEDIIASQSFLAIKKKIQLKSDVNKKTVYADVNATRIIFRNLISNAIKFTEVGGTVEITTQETEDMVRILIKDNGIGIPESDRNKIFKSISWTRVGTDKEIGSGFGLSLSKEFADKMNGNIWYDSEEGKGTTFFVELPKN